MKNSGTNSITFKELVDKWRDLTPDTYYKPSTWANYKSNINTRLLPYFGSKKLSEITGETLQRFIVSSSGELSAKTVRNTLMTLRVLWKSAKGWGYASHNPFDDLMFPRVVINERSTFTLEEIKRIIAEAPGDYKVFFWLAAETGMRAGELIGLRTEDVDVERRVVRVRQSIWNGRVQTPKSAKSVRTCAISNGLAEALRLHILSTRGAENRMRLLFASGTFSGGSRNPSRIVKGILHPILERLGIRQAGLHSFRHTAATLADQAGLPLKDRQKRMGHADSRITLDVYTHSQSENVVSEAERGFVEGLGL